VNKNSFQHQRRNRLEVQNTERQQQQKFLSFMKIPHWSSQRIMHFKSRTRRIILALCVYFVFCFVILYFPSPSELRAREFIPNVVTESSHKFNRPQTEDPSIFAKQARESQRRQNYIIENAGKCQNLDTSEPNSEKSKHVLILVSSSPGNREARQAIRETWGNETRIGYNWYTVMFLIGVNASTENDDLISRLRWENNATGDLIVGNFNDHYRSLTTKTKMGLHWFVWNCGKADVVMKADDDVYLVYDNLRGVVSELPPVTLFGYCTKNRSFVIRDPREKSYVSYFDWTEPTVPRYCFGMAYGMDNYVAKIVYQMSSRIPQFPQEDVFVGIAIEASKMRVKFDYRNKQYGLNVDMLPFGLSYCNRKDSIAFHQLRPVAMRDVHTQFQIAKNNPNFCNSDVEQYKMKRYQSSI